MNTVRPKSWFLLMPPVVLALLLGGARAMPGFTPDSCAAGQSAVLASAGGCGHCALKTQSSPAADSSTKKAAKRSCCSGGSCCQMHLPIDAACGPECHCESRAPGSDRSPYELPRQTRTLVDLELARAASVPLYVVSPQAPWAFSLESADSRGSPTLVAQHVRLQI